MLLELHRATAIEDADHLPQTVPGSDIVTGTYAEGYGIEAAADTESGNDRADGQVVASEADETVEQGKTADGSLFESAIALATNAYAPPAAPERRGRKLARKVVALVVAGLAVAGCTGKAETSLAEEKAPIAATKVTEGTVRPFDAMVQERVVASDLLSKARHDTGPSDALGKYLESRDPAGRERLADIILAAEKDEAADLIDTAPAGYGKEEELQAKLAGIDDPEAAAAATTAMEYRRAKQIIDSSIGYSSDKPSPEQARAELDAMNPDVGEAARAAYDANLAKQTVEKAGLSYDGLSVAEAEAQLAQVADRQVAAVARTAMKLQTEYRNGGSDYETLVASNEAQGNLREIVSAADDPFSDARDGLDKQAKEFDKQVENAVDASEGILGGMLAEHADGLQSRIVEGPNMLAIDKAKTIDFSTVTGGEMIPNDTALFSGGGESANKDLRQFAEIYVEGGEMKFRVVPDSGLTPEAEDALRQVVGSLSPFLAEAYKRGVVNGIHFVSSESFNGNYSHSRDSYIFLPKGEKTVDALQLVISHEIIGHALTHEGFLAPTQDEAAELERACTAVRTTVYDRLEQDLQLMPDKLDAAIADAPAEYAPIFTELKRIIDEGQLAETMTYGQSTEGHEQTTLNDCLSKNMAEIVEQIAIMKGVKAPEGGKDISVTLHENVRAYNELAIKWADTRNTYGIYHYMNESAHVEGFELDESYMGHTDDNAKEMMASLINLAILKRADLVKSLRDMPDNERDAAMMGLSVSLRFAAKNGSDDASEYFKWLEQSIETEVRDVEVHYGYDVENVVASGR